MMILRLAALLILAANLYPQISVHATTIPRRTLFGHEKSVTALAISADGSTLSSGSEDGFVKLWDVRSNREIQTLPRLTGVVSALAFSPDAKILAVATRPPWTDRVEWLSWPTSQVRFWDVAAKDWLARIVTTDFTPWSLMIAPRVLPPGGADGQMLLAAGPNGIGWWDMATGQALPRMDAAGGSLNALALSPDGKTLATDHSQGEAGKATGQVQLRDAASGAVRSTLGAYEDTISAITFARNGKLLAAGGRDGGVAVWDLQTGERRWRQPEQAVKPYAGYYSWTNAVKSLTFSPDGRYLAQEDIQGNISLWDAATGEAVDEWNQAKTGSPMAGKSFGMTFSPDAAAFYTAAGTGFTRWEINPTQGPSASPSRFEVASGVRFLNGSATVTSWNDRSPATFLFSPDGKVLVGQGDWELRRWDLVTGATAAQLRLVREPGNFWLALSPDVKLAVSSTRARDANTNSGRLDVWDVPAKKVLRSLPQAAPYSFARNAIFSPDGKLLIGLLSDSQQGSSGDRRAVRVWDVASGNLLHNFDQYLMGAKLVALAPDGRTLAFTGTFETQYWDVVDGKLLRTTRTTTGIVNSSPASISFSPDGQCLAGITTDGTLWVKTVPADELLWSVKDEDNGGQGRAGFYPTGETYHLAFTPDGKTIASGGPDGIVHLRDAATGKEKRTLRQGLPVEGLGFAPDGMALAIGRHYGDTLLWSMNLPATPPTKPAPQPIPAPAKPASVRLLRGHLFTIKTIAFSSDGATLISSDSDGTVHVWDVSTGQWRSTPLPQLPASRALAYSRDLKLLATGEGQFRQSGEVKLWDVVSGKLLRTLTGHRDAVMAVAISPDGKQVASGGWDETVEIWDANTGTVKRTLSAQVGAVFALAFSPNGETLAVAGEAGVVRLWQLSTAVLRQTLRAEGFGINSLVFSTNGQTLAGVDKDGLAQVWDVASGQSKLVLRGQPNRFYQSVALTSDGKTLATFDQYLVQLWDLTTGKVMQTMNGGTASAFSPDGSLLATGGPDGIWLWRLK